MTNFEALIFDLDGVLADTVDYHFAAWQRIADILDVPFDRAMMNRFRGRQRRDCLLELAGEDLARDAAELDRLMVLKDSYYLEDLQRMTQDDLLPGVWSFIQAATAAQLKLAVASSSMSAIPVLERTGILPYMDVVADGSTVSRSKPAPDIFVWAAGALRTRPVHTIVFEDSSAGVEAARVAGMGVVGVGNQNLTQGAHLHIPNFEHITVSELLESMARAVRLT